MRSLVFGIVLTVFLSGLAEAQTNAVCPDPAKPCKHKQKTFDAWELSFKMPASLVNNKTYRSARFYAVIVKTYGSTLTVETTSISPPPKPTAKHYNGGTRRVKFLRLTCARIYRVLAMILRGNGTRRATRC